MKKYLAIAFLLLAGCATPPPNHGIPNLHVINLGNKLSNAWRGAEPDALGCQLLKALGITKIVKLNTAQESSDSMLRALGMEIVECSITTKMQMFGGPELDAQIQKAVAAIGPNTFVHCGSDSRTRSELDAQLNTQGGQDRTGIVCAFYRVQVQHWSKADAKKELYADGFHPELLGLSRAFDNLKP